MRWIAASCLFLVPLDFVRLIGPFSLLNLLGPLLGIPLLFSSRTRRFSWFGDQYILVSLLSLGSLVISCLLSAAFTSVDPTEEVKMILVLSVIGVNLLCCRASMLYLSGREAIVILLCGFCALIDLLTLQVLLGVAEFSPSGRLQGMFRSSNGLAAFLGISVCFLVVVLERAVICPRWVSICHLALAGWLIVLSGSRGALALAFAAPLTIYLVHATMTRRIVVFFIVLLPASLNSLLDVHLLDTLSVYFDDLYLSSGITGASRFASFLSSLANNSSWSMENLDDGRSEVLDATVEALVREPSLVGHGLDSSEQLTLHFQKPHNLFIYVWYEMGPVALIGFVYYFGFFVRLALRPDKGIGSGLAPNLLIAMCISALWMTMKTPFSMQHAGYWCLIYLAAVGSQKNNPSFSKESALTQIID
jgi:hypothetical protein